MSQGAPRIAIVGSCITRDLWPIRGGGAEQLVYVSRTSLPSLFSPPVAGFRPATTTPGGLRPGPHGALVADLQKTALRRLVAFRPTHLIVDFIDERFDLLAVGEAVASHSSEMAASGYLAQPAFRGARQIPRLSDSCGRLWRSGLRELATFIQATPLAEARLILHAARWATEQQGPHGERRALRDVALFPGRPVEIAPYNACLATYDAAFEAEMPAHARVCAEGHQIAFSAHRWGLSPFHYVPAYYDEIRRQLAALGLADAFSAPAAQPSVPAA